MSFNNFEVLCAPLKSLSARFAKYATRIKYGVRYHIRALFTSDNVEKGKRPGALFSNHVTSLGFINCEMIDDMPVYDGFNKVVLGVDGIPDLGLVTETFEKHYVTKRDDAIAAASAVGSLKAENVVTLIYNMLRLFWIKKMQEDGTCTIDPDSIIYDDGHVRVTARTFLGINQTYSVDDFEPERTRQIKTLQGFDHRTRSVDGQIVIIRRGNMSDKQLTAIGYAANEFEDFGIPYRICHPTPRLCSVCVMPGERQLSQMLNWADISSGDIHMAIVAFVRIHRLQAQSYGIRYIVSGALHPHSKIC